MSGIRESDPAIAAARVILGMGLLMGGVFAPIAFSAGGDIVMKITTIVLLAGTPIVAWLAARRARRDGDIIGMKR